MLNCNGFMILSYDIIPVLLGFYFGVCIETILTEDELAKFVPYFLLLMPSSSKELKVIGKVEYFIIIMVAIIPPIVFVSFALESIARTKYRINKTMISLTCVIMDANAEAIKMFKLDNGVYPTTAEGINALVSNPNVLKLPKDAWGRPIIYVKTKDGFELISYGADRKEGGEDEGADILYSECERKR